MRFPTVVGYFGYVGIEVQNSVGFFPPFGLDVNLHFLTEEDVMNFLVSCFAKRECCTTPWCTILQIFPLLLCLVVPPMLLLVAVGDVGCVVLLLASPVDALLLSFCSCSFCFQLVTVCRCLLLFCICMSLWCAALCWKYVCYLCKSKGIPAIRMSMQWREAGAATPTASP